MRKYSDVVGVEARSAGRSGRGGFKAGAEVSLPPKKAARRLLISLLCLAFLAACAEAPKRPAYKKVPTRPKPPAEAQMPDKQKPLSEVQRANVRPSTMDAMTPQRQASNRLVSKGKALIDSGDFDRAAGVLMDAVNVDSSNGVAYYYLAVANVKLGNNEVAAGLLDKAEAQLGADEEWQSKINQLRAGLGIPEPAPVVQSPIDVSF